MQNQTYKPAISLLSCLQFSHISLMFHTFLHCILLYSSWCWFFKSLSLAILMKSVIYLHDIFVVILQWIKPWIWYAQSSWHDCLYKSLFNWYLIVSACYRYSNSLFSNKIVICNQFLKYFCFCTIPSVINCSILRLN